jgi:hypothetical protein
MRNTIVLLLGLSACSTGKIYERGPTKELVLRPRAGYQDKLTNKRCSERKKNTNDCISYDISEFDFNSNDVRKLLRDLKFICNVRGERFVPCPTARGLCQLKEVTTGTWPFRKTEIKLNKYLSLHDDYEFLIGADTYCASIYSDVGSQMFP